MSHDPHQRTQDNLNAVARQMLADGKKKGDPGEKKAEGGWEQKLKRWGPIGAVAAFILTKAKLVIPALKFLKLGTLLTMFLSIGVYAMFFGWPYAVGFVLLIFVHEMGHALAMRQQGIPAGAPVFIPFFGAVIAMKGMPRNSWVEAVVGIGGPALGTVGAAVVLAAAYALGNDLLFALASVGFLINLFNMLPVSPLDGGRIAGIFGRWMWILGYIILGVMIFTSFHPMLILVGLMGLMNLRRILNPPPGYNQVEPWRRWVMAGAYFGGIGVMVGGMMLADANLEHLSQAQVIAMAGPALLWSAVDKLED